MRYRHIFGISTLACLCIASTAPAAIYVSGGGLQWMEIGGTFDGGNLGPAGTAFALDLIGGGIYPSHTIPNVNDNAYGNDESWIGDSANSHVGIALAGGLQSISSIAYGRDNGGEAMQFPDRHSGVVTVEYTTDAVPSSGGSWTTIGTINHYLPDGVPLGALRSRFDFTPVNATGIRLVTASNGRAIDEFEVYASPLGTPAFASLPTGTPVLMDETVHTALPLPGAPIVEPGGQNGYRYVPGPGTFQFYPGPITGDNVTVNVSWGANGNHANNVDYYYDPDGPGPEPQVLLAADVNQTLLADQTTPGSVEWSGFFQIASGLTLTPGGYFVVDGGGGADPQAVTTAVWQLTAVAVPEPSSLLMLVLGCVALFGFRRR